MQVEEKSRDVTTFVSQFGKFRFTLMTFGLRSALMVFQCLMDVVLCPCYEFSTEYIDDVIVFSYSWKEHIFTSTASTNRVEESRFDSQKP